MADDVVCEGFFRAAEGAKLSCLDKFQDSGMVQFVLGNLLEAPYNFFAALFQPQLWLNWSNPEALMRFIYYGGSVEFFFVCFVAFIILTIVGMRKRAVMCFAPLCQRDRFLTIVRAVAAKPWLLRPKV